MLVAAAFFLTERYKQFFIERRYLSFFAYSLVFVSLMWGVTEMSTDLRRDNRALDPGMAEWIPMISYGLIIIPMLLISLRISRLRKEN